MRTPTLLSAIVLLAMACDDGGETGDTSGTDDTDAVSYDDGCIDVSSADQGFAKVEDALTVAQDGDTIELCQDVTVPIVVDKQLTILGNGVMLTPPPNDMAVTVAEGGDLTISDVDIQTTRSGFVVQADAKLNADNIDIIEVANYGFDIAPGAEATINDATIAGPDWGAFRVTGGTATITNAEVTDAGSFGVYADESATVTLQDSSFGGIAHRDSSTQLWDIDGVGVWVEGGSTVDMSGNSIVAAEIAGVSVDENSTVTMDGDQIVGTGLTFAGITVRSSSLTASGVENTDYVQYGVLSIDATTLEFESLTAQTNPEASVPNNVEQDSIGSVGVYVLESEVTIAGTEEFPSVISGNNGAGVLVSPRSGGSVSGLTMSHALVQDNASFGITVYSGDATLDNVTVSETRRDDAYCITDTGYRCNMAVALWSSSATLTDSSVLDSTDWGLAVVNGVLEVEGGVFARNEANGIFGQGGSITAKDVLFEQGKDVQITMQANGTVLVDNCTFRDGEHIDVFEYEAGDGVMIRQVSYYQARDIYVSETDLTVLNSTFENGEQGITVAGGEGGATATITDSTFSGYNQYGVYGSTNAELTVERTDFTDMGRYAFYCYSCSLDASEVSFKDFTTYKYKFEYYQDGEEVFTNDYEQVDSVMDMSLGDVVLEDVTIEGTDGRVMYASNTTLEMDGVTMSEIARNHATPAALDINWTQRTTDGSTDPQSYPNAVLNGVTIQGPVGGYTNEMSGEVYPTNVMRMSGWTDSTTGEQPEGVIEISDLLITGTTDRDLVAGGITATNLGSFNMTGFDIDGVQDFGLVLNQTSGAIVGAAGSRTGTVSAPGGIDIDADRKTYDPASVSLTDVTVIDAVDDGITVNSGEHTFSGVTVTEAGGYGATCTDVTFVTCDASLDGALGMTDGCDACIPEPVE